jgi:hypothetical protein
MSTAESSAGIRTPHARLAAQCLIALCATVLSGCGDESKTTQPDVATELYSIGAIVQNPEGRTLLVQTLGSLDHDIDNSRALEFSGNARHWSNGGAVFIGLAEEPTIEKYVPDSSGALVSAGRVSFLSHGLSAIPAGNIFLSETKAYLFAESQYQVIVWNPSTMEITGEIQLSSLKMDGYDIELWRATRAGSRVYAPLRYVNFDAKEILHRVSLVDIDADRDEIIAVAHDDRCVGAEEPAILDDGSVYVLADGRSYLAQVYAAAQKQEPPKNCILRMLPGQTSFDPDFHVEIPSLTGGKDAASALWHTGVGVGFAKMYHADKLAPGADASGFQFWMNPVFKLWRVTLGQTPIAEEVQGAPFSMLAFGGQIIDGKLFIGETENAQTSTVYEVDPVANQARARFTMQGAMRDLYRLR